MATSKKTLEFTAKNVKAFSNWLKRFALIDNSLLLEVDTSNSFFIAKTYNEERSVVKMSSIRFDEAGLLSKVSKDTKRIKIGLFNIPRLIKIMDQFNDAEFSLSIEYQEIINDNEQQYAAEKLLLKNKSLKMTVDCTSLNIFKYIPDDLFKTTIASVEERSKFKFTKSTLEQINTLNNIDDNDYKFMKIKIADKKVFISGNTYEKLIIEDIVSKIKDAGITIFKDQYEALDAENYDVILGEDRLVFTSDDSETVTVISEADDKD